MKKSLSLLLALAMVFGMFASMASAADSDLTTEQKYQQLVDSGVLKGTTSGLPQLEDNLTRAQFATIAVAIAGLTPATGTTSSFSDVKSTEWWYGAIEAAAQAGLVNGTGNGKFTPKSDVTVQEVIKIAVTIAGLTPVEGAEVEGAADWAGPYIQAAIDAGLPIASNYKDAATRGQTVELAYTVFQALQVKPLSDVKAVLNADDTITVTGKSAGADSVKVVVGSATAAVATLSADGSFTYTSAAQTAGTVDVKVTAYKGETELASTTASVTVDGFSVASVTVLNAKQIAVQFNKAVQVGIAVGGHKYGVGTTNSYFSLANGATTYPTAIDVSDDKTTVTLTFAGGFKLNSYSEVAVSSSLKSASGKALTAYKQAVLLDDTTAPTVSGVSYSGGKATVSFSEPLIDAGVVSINGAQISSSASSAVYYTINRNDTTTGSNYGGDITSITISNLTADTNYTLNIVGGYDAAAYYDASHSPNYFDYTGTINVPADNTAPTIVSVAVDGDIITATFSEALSDAGYVYQGSADNVGVAGVLSSDKLSASYTVGWRSGSFLNATAIFKNYKDLVGNTGSNFTAAVTLTLDSTNPTVASALYDGTYLVIKFSEALNSINTGNTLSVKYTNTNSVVTYPDIPLNSINGIGQLGYDVNNDGDTDDSGENFYIRVPASLNNGTYSITVPAGTVTDKATHGNDSGTVSLTVSSSTTTGSVTATIYTNGLSTDAAHYDGTLKNNQIKFVFNKKLTTAALDKSKFLINGAALPAEANLYFLVDTNIVIAELPNGAIPVNGYRTIKVANIVDENGNTLSGTLADVQQTVYLKENLKPVAQSVSVVSDSEIIVTFSETLGALPGTLASGLTVKVNDNSVTITGWYTVDNVLHLTATSAPFSTSKTTSVQVSGSSIIDANNNTAADGTVTK